MIFPLHRFEEFGELTANEKAALHSLGDTPLTVRRHARIRQEAVTPTSFFLLLDGWVSAAHILRNGQRQILKVHLPGDALGTPSMAMTRSVEELIALTDATIINVPFDRFGKLFDDHPRVAARFMLSVQQERVALMDRLIANGRTSAAERVAAFLLDLTERLEPLGLMHSGSFHMVLTQEQIGDVVSLTAVHTNRSLRELENLGFIKRERALFTILDRAAFEAFAKRPIRCRQLDAAWLPRPR